MGVGAAIFGSSLIGGASSAYGSRKAAKAQAAASQAATAEQRRQYDQTRADLQPWRAAGNNALSRIDRYLGGDDSDFFTSPDYQFRRDEGTRDIGNFFSGGGSGVYSGNAMKELANFNSGLASGEIGNWFNRQFGVSEAGRGATNTTAAMGQNTANNISNNMMNAGRANADRWMNTASGVNNAAQAGIGNYLYMQGRKPQDRVT